MTLAEVLEQFRPAIRNKLEQGWTVADVVTQLNALDIPVSSKLIRALVNASGRKRTRKGSQRTPLRVQPRGSKPADSGDGDR